MQVFTIGRDNTCDIVVNDHQVSRHHCQIARLDSGEYRLVDLGSTNGTFLNGNRITGSTVLSPNDTVRIGSHTLPWKQYFSDNSSQQPEEIIAGVAQPPLSENTPQTPVPTVKLRENRSFWKVFLLNIVTLGIYGIFVYSHISKEINTIATPHDGRHTMHYCIVLFLLSWLTLGIFPLIWNHKLASRIAGELRRRGIVYSYGPGTFWGWGFFGALLLGIGPLIYLAKLLKAMNFLCHDYNING